MSSSAAGDGPDGRHRRGRQALGPEARLLGVPLLGSVRAGPVGRGAAPAGPEDGARLVDQGGVGHRPGHLVEGAAAGAVEPLQRRRRSRMPWPAAASSGRAPKRSCRNSWGDRRGHMRSSASATSGVRRRRWARSACSSALGRRSSSTVVGPPGEPGPVVVGQGPQHLGLDEAAAHVVRARAPARQGDDLLGGRARRRSTPAPKGTSTSCRSGRWRVRTARASTLTMRTSPLSLATAGSSDPADPDLGHQAGHGGEADAGLPQRGEHLLDVAQEERVGPDHQDALALQREAVGVEEVGGPVQGHGGLAGARAALDHQHPARAGSG